ncbi:MAG: type III-B CRISPR module RAMP protein Cmr4 [candidate division KSB1 bacterium]|nr:type III-B CRISPR module RAMP protein Cmr4 [candidate division KSB1 bacterium]
MTSERYAFQRYLLMTLDPVHPGAGGYRLGRVDLSIAREPGTRLPKIPGSSLHGAARAYAAYLYGTPEAAGQSQEKIDNPAQNPICYTFGYLKGKAMSSGVVNLFDARILLFPVHSMRGPVWVSTMGRLREAGFQNVPDGEPAEGACRTTFAHSGKLNLGWLMLNAEQQQVSITAPQDWQKEQWQAVQNHIVLVPESLFSPIVNSNLEVRTSVSINPQTGAAAEGELYTYEAIPRATFLTAEVVLDDFSHDKQDKRPQFPIQKTAQNSDLPGGAWQGPLDVVRAGLKMMEYLGVGGMGTRGFGRIQIVGKPAAKKQDDIFKSLNCKEGQDEPAK